MKQKPIMREAHPEGQGGLSVKLVQIRNVYKELIGAIAAMDLRLCRTGDGTLECAAIAIAAVQPCDFGASLRGLGA